MVCTCVLHIWWQRPLLFSFWLHYLVEWIYRSWMVMFLVAASWTKVLVLAHENAIFLFLYRRDITDSRGPIFLWMVHPIVFCTVPVESSVWYCLLWFFCAMASRSYEVAGASSSFAAKEWNCANQLGNLGRVHLGDWEVLIVFATHTGNIRSPKLRVKECFLCLSFCEWFSHMIMHCVLVLHLCSVSCAWNF